MILLHSLFLAFFRRPIGWIIVKLSIGFTIVSVICKLLVCVHTALREFSVVNIIFWTHEQSFRLFIMQRTQWTTKWLTSTMMASTCSYSCIYWKSSVVHGTYLSSNANYSSGDGDIGHTNNGSVCGGNKNKSVRHLQRQRATRGCTDDSYVGMAMM